MKYLTFLSKIAFIFFISFGLSVKSFAGNGVVVKTTNYLFNGSSGEKTKSGSSTMYMTSQKLMIKQEESDGKSTTIIFNSTKNEMILFLNSQEYIVLDEKEMAVIKQQLAGMREMMEKMRANMTEEQKKMMDKNFPGSGQKVTTSYEKGGSKTINGWNSSKYSALQNGTKVSELYIASYGALGVSQSDFAVMKSMMEFFRKHLADFSNQFGMGGDASSFMALSGDNPAFNAGVPVKITAFSAGRAISDTIIDSVEKKAINESLFTIPSHMKRKDLAQMMQGGFR
ncbi:hypothetical protein QQ020_35605 [Fulvivirgaceae bacterium BMA12]|uniref:DUF4412 domain-containing protein n=1 Tax=Agaribacillus aureus TaxID=3051825 RepID=A0ABT8LI36_9BACT|nr:hypothetical protein [Fulvivirgaceae bacterium BMA12]